ncbi:MAG: porin [Planctomycetaceae bacterium]|jgi:hypothetical protein|nr:porin [Planctomycetaceae bacterium]
MKNKIIIIVTIIITAFYSAVLRPMFLSANDNTTSTVSSPFPQPEIFKQYQLSAPASNTHFDQTTNHPPTFQLFDQNTNRSTSNTQFDQTMEPSLYHSLPTQSFNQPVNQLAAGKLSNQLVNQPVINNSEEIPLSFTADYRKVTGPIIYDAESNIDGCCDPVCAPNDIVSMVDDIGCYEDVTCASVWYSRINFYGWLQGGLYANSHGSTTQRYYGLNRKGQRDLLQRSSGGNGASLGNVRQTGAVLNQLWLGLSRNLDMSTGFDWGFRSEFLLGTDAWLTQSYGDATLDYWTLRRDYAISIPQLYVTMGYRNLSVKVGKFESLLGYEHIQAVDSPFYSHSNLFYAEPQSHSGVIFDYNVNPDFWFSLGYVQGADSTLSNRFEDNGLIGGIYWRCCPSMTLWYTIYYSKSRNGTFANNEPHTGGNVFRHTFVLNWKLTSRFDYVFQWDLGHRRGNRVNAGNSSYFGWAQYFMYKIHSRLNAGIRIDQLHSNTLMATSGFARPNTGYFVGNLYGITIGLEWKPYQNLSFKPELRYDYSSTRGNFGKGNHRDQISFGFGIVFDF